MANTETLKYKKLSNFFLEEIRNGKYGLGKKLPSERELAKKYNFAHMTVNKALNGLVATGHLERRRGDGTYVTEHTLPKTACLILDYMDDMHAMFPYTLQKILFDAGFIVTVFDTLQVSQMTGMLKTYLSNYPDLLILDGWCKFPFELLKAIPEATKKIIFQRCETKPVFDASYVLIDSEKCGYLATKTLILSGRQRIGIVLGTLRNKYANANLFHSGCQKALAEFKVENAVFIKHNSSSELEGIIIPEGDAIKMLQGKNRLDGIVGSMDCELIPFITAANKLGISIPEQLSLIGRYNTPWSEEYKLTSVDVQPNLIVENIKTILNLKENKKIMVAPKIVFRESCPQVNKINPIEKGEKTFMCA